MEDKAQSSTMMEFTNVNEAVDKSAMYPSQNAVLEDHSVQVHLDKSGKPEPPPPYLPQPEEKDCYPDKPQHEEPLKPLDHAATGRTDWRPDAGLTGTRPVVDTYSLSRYSDAERREHNQQVMSNIAAVQKQSALLHFESKRAVITAAKTADKTQTDNTVRITQRAQETIRWKVEVEQMLDALTEEINLLELCRKRVLRSNRAIKLIKSIGSECILQRNFRDGYELSKDPVEIDLTKEITLVHELDNLQKRLLNRIHEQHNSNVAAKEKLENDWSDKYESLSRMAASAQLNNTSTTAMFKPASAVYSENQSTPAGWENSNRELLATTNAVRMQSLELRTLIDGPVLTDCVRDLRTQADKCDIAFARLITENITCVKSLEDHLTIVSKKITDTEQLIVDLTMYSGQMDIAMKVSQTRLDNLRRRPRIEDCRDKAHRGLMDEVKTLTGQKEAVQFQLKEAERALVELQKERSYIEKEIEVKLKTVYIDRDRCQVCRAQYPSTSFLAGY